MHLGARVESTLRWRDITPDPAAGKLLVRSLEETRSLRQLPEGIRSDLGGFVCVNDSDRHSAAIAYRVAVRASPLAYRAKVEIATAPGCAPDSIRAGSFDHSRRIDVRRESTSQRICVTGRQVDLIRATINRERNVLTFTILKNRSVQVVRELRHMLGSHATYHSTNTVKTRI